MGDRHASNTKDFCMRWTSLVALLLGWAGSALGAPPEPPQMLPVLRARAAAGEQLDVIVEFRDKAAELGYAGARRKLRRDYIALPMRALRGIDSRDLAALATYDGVVDVYEDLRLHPHLSESLPLIEAPAAHGAGAQGAGSAVVILDTGVDYAHAAFGHCTAPGDPVPCRVAVAFDVAADDGALDDASRHGTHVSAIVGATAPGAALIVLDVFDGGTALASDVIAGIEWALVNQAQYGIAAINLSLGGTEKFSQPCRFGNPFRSPIQAADAVGIVVVVSSGNNGWSDGMTSPACTPGALAVGAVYDAALGSINWTSCQDAGIVPDQVACFSNSASFLGLLAPGAKIDAAGLSMGGTSQAAPHVSAAIAALRSARPADSASALTAHLLDSGTPILDPRNGVVTPRLNLFDALLLATGDPGAENRVQVPMMGWPLLPLLAMALALLGARSERRHGRRRSSCR